MNFQKIQFYKIKEAFNAAVDMPRRIQDRLRNDAVLRVKFNHFARHGLPRLGAGLVANITAILMVSSFGGPLAPYSPIFGIVAAVSMFFAAPRIFKKMQDAHYQIDNSKAAGKVRSLVRHLRPKHV